MLYIVWYLVISGSIINTYYISLAFIKLFTFIRKTRVREI